MSFRFSAAVVAALLAGCAPAAPASPAAVRTSPTAPLAAASDLPPVAAPRLPVALRTDPTSAAATPMDHSAMNHGAMDHAAMGHAMPEPSADGDAAPAPMDHAAMGHNPPAAAVDHAAMGHAMPESDLTPAAIAPPLDAYLALHAALVAGDLVAGRDAAGELAASAVQVGLGPEIQAHAIAADAATDLDGLRTAFGRLGPPVIALVEAVGAPPGRELSAFRCGMADAPQDGVWLQATADLANPLLAGMTACGRRTGAVGEMNHDAMDHDAMDHESGMQHD